VNFCDKRTGTINNFAILALKGTSYIRRNTVRPDQHGTIGLDFLCVMYQKHAVSAEVGNHLFVVRNFAEHINRLMEGGLPKVILRSPNSLIHTEAETGGLG
jgi:hypothetical protein